MAALYGPHYERLWRDALLLPGHDDLLESLAAEVAEHLGGTPAETRAAMQDAFERRGSLAAERFPDDPSQLVDYYDDVLGIYVGAWWHSLAADRYALHAVAGLQATQMLAGGGRVFEFGHGIGSAALLFARHGFAVTAGDISERYRAFVRERVARRGAPIELVALERESPREGAFDAVVSFDVLEHVPDPLAPIADMRSWLVPGGVLVLSVAIGVAPESPEHLIRRRLGFEDRIRALGFERVPHPQLLVFYRRELGAARRRLYRVQDAVVAARDDAAARSPAAAVLLRPHRPPPL